MPRDLRRWLVRQGYAATTSTQSADSADGGGLLDDAVVRAAAHPSQALDRAAASRRSRRELAARGVGRGVADAAIDEVMSDEAMDERSMAEQVARRRAIALARLDLPSSAAGCMRISRAAATTPTIWRAVERRVERTEQVARLARTAGCVTAI